MRVWQPSGFLHASRGPWLEGSRKPHVQDGSWCPSGHEVLLVQGIHHQLQAAKDEARRVHEPQEPSLPTSDPLSSVASLSFAETGVWFQVGWAEARYACPQEQSFLDQAWRCSDLKVALEICMAMGCILQLQLVKIRRLQTILCNMQELAGGIAILNLAQQVPASVVAHPKQLVEALIKHQVPCHRAAWLIRTFLHLQQGYVGRSCPTGNHCLDALPRKGA